ncbi:MAG: bifunctional hydroxymethylpyrimidine kinase/phosphomethylpyrimidine kinase [Pacificimonas sp.]
MSPPRILAIAGSDSGGGAGLQADIKTITMLGGYAMTAVTAVTAQDTTAVHRIDALPIPAVLAQLDACLDDIGVDAIKTGMLGRPKLIRAIFDRIADLDVPVVVDPVLVATSGDRLVGDDAVQAIIKFALPRATVVTPNLPELALLAGEEIDDEAALVDVAHRFANTHGVAVLAKGGHLIGDELLDVLATPDGEAVWYASERIDTRHTHGTGCTLASAVATDLGRGLSLPDATEHARDYVRQAILAAPGFGKGNGPLGHGWPLVR